MTPCSTREWIEELTEQWRERMAAVYAMQAMAGDIPAAQIPILADMSANRVKAMLISIQDDVIRTPRTDEEVEIAKKYPATEHGLWISAEFARHLERDLYTALLALRTLVSCVERDDAALGAAKRILQSLPNFKKGMPMDFDERWLEAGGVVPVDIPTTGALLEEIKRLRGVLSGDPGFLRAEVEDGGITMGLTHPIVNVLAASMADMLGESNYVEMEMRHRETGEAYRIHVQRQSRPTPHELRRKAEIERDEALAKLAALQASTTPNRSDT